MENEVELKLLVNDSFATFLSQEMTAFHILKHKQVLLGNCYYDTKDKFFSHQKMGLRVRTENDTFTMTLKTNGSVLGGLHIRPEYNVELASAQPEKEKLLQLLSENSLSLDITEVELLPIFSTDFLRQQWLIELGNGAEIEVALDQGSIEAGEKSEPICEVEFELKKGHIEDLLSFVAGLSLTDGIRLGSLSKAKRGYKLANPTDIPLVDWLIRWREVLDSTQIMQNSTQKLTALFNYEQKLIEETTSHTKETFSQEFIKTVERISAFFNLYLYYVENAKWLTEALQEQESKTKVRLDNELISELNESNQRLLDKLKTIIRQHSETKNNQAAIEQLFDMLYQGRYVNRMINLIKLTIQ